jgi:hypothetical protein
MTTPMNPKDLSDDDLASLLTRRTELMDAPEWVIQRALTMFPGKQPMKAATGSVLQRIMAVLTFDSANTLSPAFGIRSAYPATRQMLFSAHGRDVDLRLVPAHSEGGPAWDVLGQILGPDEGGTVTILGESNEWRSMLSELSEFRVCGIPHGAYTVTLYLNGTTIVLPEFHVPPKRT